MKQGEKKGLSLGQALFLSVGVPLVLFGAAEIFSRVLDTPTWFAAKNTPQMLEMPTWMNQDQNRLAQAGKVATDKDTLEWLKLFEEGDGFRVRLIPGIDTKVKNTFAQIAAEKRDGFSIQANSLGFRGPEPAKDGQTFRIVVYGDSSSFGWGVEEQDRFDHVLVEALSERMQGQKISLLNFAIPGDSSEYGRLIFDRFAEKYAADLVILGFGANDAKPVLASHQMQVDKFKQSASMQALKKFLDHSYIFKSMRLALSKVSDAQIANASGEIARKPAVDGERYRKNLKHMLNRASELGATRSVVLSLCTPGNYAKRAHKVAANNNAIYYNGQASLLKLIPKIKAGEIFPELVSEMRQRYPQALNENDLWYVSSDACHPNKLGHKIVGLELAKLISEAK